LGKRRTLLPHPAIRRFLLRTSLRADGHAPAHRALSEFEILAFTLHLHPQFIDTVRFVGEGLCLFWPSPVKERGVKSSPASCWCIVFYGLMVKRWRQKTKNAGRACNARALGVEVGAEGAEVGDGVESMIERPDRTLEKKDFW